MKKNSQTSRPCQVVLSIAGSDPSGGAGIQADLKTFTALGVYGAAAITCLTAQNSKGVTSYRPVAADFVRQQIALVLEDLPVSHIKTGMVGTAAVAAAINKALATFDGEVICDPVLAASSGLPLLNPAALAAFCRQVIGRATVLTPNVPELRILTALPCQSRAELITAATRLFERFGTLRVLIVKGGHLAETQPTVTDYLLRRQGASPRPDLLSLSHRRLVTANLHGTGCTFASAFAAFHLLTGDDEQAFRQSVAFMDKLIRLSAAPRSSRTATGSGPLAHHLLTANRITGGDK